MKTSSRVIKFVSRAPVQCRARRGGGYSPLRARHWTILTCS